jgi:cyclophilin family peptidyl-prolyl cis-trans isomerase
MLSVREGVMCRGQRAEGNSRFFITYPRLPIPDSIFFGQMAEGRSMKEEFKVITAN